MSQWERKLYNTQGRLMVFLKKYVKFRKEPQYILMCDCSTLTNYQLPLEFYSLLLILKNGYDSRKPLGILNEKKVLEDLATLDMLSSKFNSNIGFEDKDWVKLQYNETEFS